MELGKSWCGEK